MFSSEIAEAIAPKIFEVYPPTSLGWRIGSEMMLRLGRSLTDCRYIVTDLGRQLIYVAGIIGMIRKRGADRQQLARKEKRTRQQEGTDNHSISS